MKEIRCPYCDRKLAEHLEDGFFIATCPRCHEVVTIDRRVKTVVKS